MLDVNEIKRQAKLRHLAESNPLRLDIITLLKENSTTSLEIALVLNKPEKIIERNLNILKRAGIVNEIENKIHLK